MPHLWRRLAAGLLLVGVTLPSVTLAQLPSPSVEPITPLPQEIVVDKRQATLGAVLFSDRRLSGDGSRSCASCHDLQTNGATVQRRDRTPDGKPLEHNTNTVFNAGLSFRKDWVGDARTLEEQAGLSLTAPGFMGAQPTTVLNRLRADPATTCQFRLAFGHGPDWPSLLIAIATFERTLVTPQSRFDLWLGGDQAALTSGELTGYQLFKSIGCVSCHQGVNIGGNLFEKQRVINPHNAAERQVFRVPSLRNVATTAPYFDDGSAPTLAIAVHRMASVQLGRDLSDDQVASIVAFLNTLTGRYNGHPVAAAK